MISKKNIKQDFESPLNSSFGIDFYDLYNLDGLKKVAKKFDEFFAKKNDELWQQFTKLKNNKNNFSKKQQDGLLIDAARVLEDFIVQLFQIENENFALQNSHKKLQDLYFVKREFVQRIVAKKYQNFFGEKPQIVDNKAFTDVLEFEKFFAAKVVELTIKQKELSDAQKKQIDNLELYAAWALYNKEGIKFHEEGVLFKLPQKIDHQKLFNFDKKDGACLIDQQKKYQRQGFDLTDSGFNLAQSLAEANYCIFCHNQDKDSCRSGIKEKNSSNFKQDALGLELHGCPLDQKISEMNLLKSEGFSLASLAIAMVDNPLLAGTGHRICNDCMKSCIFQKQDAVNIPQIESENLQDVLKLPYGFEIYSLLSRWNPLNLEQELPKENSGKKVLIAGLGPAGYSLAHYLLRDGHNIVAIDGLKIEPLNEKISGIDALGNRVDFKPIKFVDEIYQPLSKRLIQGFGGVAEYGITVRWNKNFLLIIRLLLERLIAFRMFGGIRFGSTITDEIAFKEYGFDHVALCIGAGRPNVINIKNNYAKGIRMASDFLMSLQLNGAFKEDLFTNLQIRMPIVVVGAGLTAVDCACEAQEYYFSQIKKFSQQFEKLKNIYGEEKLWQNFNDEEKIIAQEFLDHQQEVAKNGRASLLKKVAGVKILYRKKIQDAPSYKLNHQELKSALEEGVQFVENAKVSEAILDEFGAIKAIKCEDEKIFLCKSLIVAAGTTPNLAPILEDGLNFQINQKYLQAIDKNGKKIAITHEAKPLDFSVFTKIDDKNKAVSFFGDLHPNFEGNVVKAMASAKLGSKAVSALLKEVVSESNVKNNDFFAKINAEFLVKIKEVNRLSSHVVEVFVHAPLLAKQTQLGQIFRLQNYHALAAKKDGYLLAMEGVPVTALSVDRVSGVISGIVVETGGSASLIKNFKAGEPCIFMGPSGKPTEIAKNETVILIGGGRGNMPLAAIAEVYKNNGCKIIFCAGYRKNSYIVRQEIIEKNSDVFICAIEEEKPNIKLNRPQDQQYQGSVIDAIKKYFANNQEKIDRIFTIGSDKMMAEIAKLRHENMLKNFSLAPIAITSLNAPMQCMLKGVCSQCLQKRQNENGDVEYFYSCASQDQNMDRLDFKHLHARCEQNSLQEKMVKMLNF